MKLYLCNKTVLRFYPHAVQFIKDYSTNIPEAPRNAFVNLQGKVVAVAEQFKKSEDEVWAAVENRFVERLLAHLKKYLSLTDTAVQKLDSQKVYWDLETRRCVVTEETLPAEATEEQFTLFRVQNDLPLQGVDYDEEMVLNLGDDTLVSYDKGCYLGQEIVARVHYRSQPPKKLTVRRLRELGPAQAAAMTSRVKDPQTGEIMGFVFDKTADEV